MNDKGLKLEVSGFKVNGIVFFQFGFLSFQICIQFFFFDYVEDQNFFLYFKKIRVILLSFCVFLEIVIKIEVISCLFICLFLYFMLFKIFQRIFYIYIVIFFSYLNLEIQLMNSLIIVLIYLLKFLQLLIYEYYLKDNI